MALAHEGIAVVQTCRILQISRASIYRRRSNARCDVQVNDVVEEPIVDSDLVTLTDTIRGLAAEHPFWGYRRITTYVRRTCGLRVNPQAYTTPDALAWPFRSCEAL